MRAWMSGLALLGLACGLPAAALDDAGAPADPSALAAKAPAWISVSFGPADECGGRPLTLEYKAPRPSLWQKLLLAPRCSVAWTGPAIDGALVKDDRSIDATFYQAYWLPGGEALLVLQSAGTEDDAVLLDANLYRANGKQRRVKPAVGNGSFHLSPDQKELWYVNGGDGADGSYSFSLHRLSLAEGAEAYQEPETVSQEDFQALGALPLEPIAPPR